MAAHHDAEYSGADAVLIWSLGVIAATDETAPGFRPYRSRCHAAFVRSEPRPGRIIDAAVARRSQWKLTMDDKRKFPRTEVETPAHVSFGGTSLSCMVRNISDEGAAIDVDNASYIPERFRLVMSDQAVRDCRLVWIKKNRIGVAFEA